MEKSNHRWVNSFCDVPWIKILYVRLSGNLLYELKLYNSESQCKTKSDQPIIMGVSEKPIYASKKMFKNLCVCK